MSGVSSRRVSRRRVLAGAAAAATVPIAGWAGRAGARTLSPRGSGTVFYVSSAGNDAASGRTPDQPWQSPARVTTALNDGTVTRGDSVLFRRGEVFFGALTGIPDGDPAGPALRLGAYGTGIRPQLTAYKLANLPAGWSRQQTGVWRIDLSAGSGAYTGNIDSGSANVGFIRVNGVIKPAKKWTLDQLVADWDFYSDNEQYLYVRLDDNPGSQGDVRIAVDGNLVTVPSAVSIRSLTLCGTGGHGLRAPDVERNISVVNCVITEIGGSQLVYAGAPSQTRYGNGVEIWIGASDVTVAGNRISRVYDSGLTYQGPQNAGQLGWTNVHAHDNVLQECTQAFEMWSDGTDTAPGTGFVNCSFTDNLCLRSGYSWSAGVRPDRAGKGTHLLFYDTQLPTDLRITGNRFQDAAQNYTYLNSGTPPAGLVVDSNQISLRAGTRLEYQRPETIEQASQWTATVGLDRHSTFTVLT